MFGLTTRKPEAPFFKAVSAGDTVKMRDELTRNLALASAQVNAAVRREVPGLEEGDTALHLAARHGHSQAAALLLSLRAPVDAVTPEGVTPLHLAAAAGHDAVAALLLEHGASPNSPDLNGVTPLHRAARTGRVSIVQTLLRHGGDATARDRDQATPLLEAAQGLSLHVLRVLLGAGADVSERDARGRTPMHRVIIGAADSVGGREGSQPVAPAGLVALVELLLGLGADINALDQAGETPLDLLVYLGGRNAEPRLVALFLNRGGQCVRYRKLQPKPVAVDRDATPPPTHAPSFQQSASPASWGDAPITLTDQPLTFGRNPDCDIRYLSLTLSHRHAKIEKSTRGWVISDLGSRNGVCIDNARVQGPHLLRPNELITLGAYEFEFDGSRLIPTHGELSDEELQDERQRASNQRGTRG